MRALGNGHTAVIRSSFFVSICLLILCSHTYAKEYLASDNDPCFYDNGQPVSLMPEITQCALHKRLDKEEALKMVWSCVISNYKPKDSLGYKALLNEQVDWETFKESACQSYFRDLEIEGDLQYELCKSSIIQQRVDYLNHFLYPWTGKPCSKEK